MLRWRAEIVTVTEQRTFRMPNAPQTMDDAGVGMDLIVQLVTKTLHFSGELSGTALAKRLGVVFSIVEPCLDLLKRERHCEIVGGAVLGAPSYTYRLTDAGRARAAMFFSQNQYIGRVPVPLTQYRAYMKALGGQPLAISRAAVRNAFRHLVLSDGVLDQLGPAIATRHSLFIYGPPGNGKTVISQALQNFFTQDIAIPHALSVDGHIIRVFDPVNHERVANRVGEGLERNPDIDNRWVHCRRPLVTAGGELTMEALELVSSGTGFYRAPLQAVANGGVLVIDDFGRQHASPRDLLNRWIVPLESRVDYLTLPTGQKFELPFEALIVFATNLKPSELVDEAFLRRIRYKIFVESPTVDQFIQIFDNYCREQQLHCDRSLVETFAVTELLPRGVPLRGCQPRDLIDHALALATYLDQPRQLTLELLNAAMASCFVEDRAVASV
jgi:predicted ATPase with chaperone activity